MYKFAQDIEDRVFAVRGKYSNTREKVFYMHAVLGLSDRNIVARNVITDEEYAANCRLNKEDFVNGCISDKVKVSRIKSMIDTFHDSVIIIISGYARNGLEEYVINSGLQLLVSGLELNLEQMANECVSFPEERIQFLAFAYYTCKLKYRDNLREKAGTLHVNDILMQHKVPLIPLIYGDRASTFRLNSQMKGDFPIRIDIKDRNWPPEPSAEFSMIDYYYLLVLAIGWNNLLKAALIDKREVWNDLKYRVCYHQSLISDSKEYQQAVLGLELTSYVAMLGSNYGLLHAHSEADLQPFATQEGRVAFASVLEQRWKAYSDSVKGASQKARNDPEVQYVLSAMRSNWPASIESGLASFISDLMKREKENPYNLQESVLANPLSANLIVHGARNGQNVMIIQKRNKKKVGHGMVTLQASAAGFVSPYIDQRRGSVNTSNPDLLNAFYTESLQEIGNVDFDRINVHGVFRDLVNFEVGLAGSAGVEVVKVSPARETGVEVEMYYFEPDNTATILNFLNSKKIEDKNEQIWDCMMPLGLSALLSYMASNDDWSGVFDVWSMMKSEADQNGARMNFERRRK